MMIFHHCSLKLCLSTQYKEILKKRKISSRPTELFSGAVANLLLSEVNSEKSAVTFYFLSIYILVTLMTKFRVLCTLLRV